MIIRLDDSPETMKLAERYKDDDDLIVAARGAVFGFNGDSISVLEPVKSFAFPEYKMVEDVHFIGNISQLYSPKKLPENAFPYLYTKSRMTIRYVQVTGKGVLYSRGIFFAKEPLGCGEEAYYSVWKDDVWYAWVYGKLLFTDGERIWDDIIPLQELEEIFPSFVSSVGGNVLVKEDHVLAGYHFEGGAKVTDESFYLVGKIPAGQLDRVKAKYQERSIYVPKHLIIKGEVLL